MGRDGIDLVQGLVVRHNPLAAWWCRVLRTAALLRASGAHFAGVQLLSPSQETFLKTTLQTPLPPRFHVPNACRVAKKNTNTQKIQCVKEFFDMNESM